MLPVGVVETARGPALATADRLEIGAVDLHGVDLIAAVAVPNALEREALSIEGEIRLGVLTAIRKLRDVPKVAFLLQGNRRPRALRGRRRGGRPARALYGSKRPNQRDACDDEESDGQGTLGGNHHEIIALAKSGAAAGAAKGERTAGNRLADALQWVLR